MNNDIVLIISKLNNLEQLLKATIEQKEYKNFYNLLNGLRNKCYKLIK